MKETEAYENLRTCLFHLTVNTVCEPPDQSYSESDGISVVKFTLNGDS